jgi:lysozyme
MEIDMSNYVYGPDMSKWQDKDTTPQRPDFTKSVQQGSTFTFIKASQGLLYDPDFFVNWENAKQAGLKRGAYHFADKHYGTAKQQAEKLYSAIKNDPGELPPILDFEDGTGTIGLSFIKTFLERIKELTGRTPILYINNAHWSQLKASENAIWALDYPLWISYPIKSLDSPVIGVPEKILSMQPVVPEPWKRKGVPWKFWQYTWVGDGPLYGMESKGVDLNLFNGNAHDFMEWLGNGEIVDPVKPPDYVRILKCGKPDFGWLFFRNRPEQYEGAALAVGTGEVLKLVEPGKIHGDIDYWHVERDGFEGYVSAGSIYTEPV